MDVALFDVDGTVFSSTAAGDAVVDTRLGDASSAARVRVRVPEVDVERRARR